jgi:fimbrial chaperone protein
MSQGRQKKGGLLARLCVALVVCLGPASTTLAGSFTVNPVRVTLTDTQGIAALTVRNLGTEPTVVQLDLMDWSQARGDNILTPSEQLLATPPLFTLPPGGSQIIRVGLRKPAEANRESTYRVILREVLPERTDEQGLRVALQLSLPVFVVPHGRYTPKLDWKLVHTGGDGLRLTATNVGTAHVQLASLRIMLPDERTSIANRTVPEYLLPGTSRSWELHSSADLTTGAPLRLHAQTDAGELRANLVIEADGALVAGH